jgi:hypothetical protein
LSFPGTVLRSQRIIFDEYREGPLGLRRIFGDSENQVLSDFDATHAHAAIAAIVFNG